MPRWHAAEQVVNFASERRFPPPERDLFRAWANARATEGDPSDAIPKAAPAQGGAWAMGTLELTVTMPAAFDVPATGSDIYRAFPSPLDFPHDVYATAVNFKPGSPSVVHPTLMFLDSTVAGRKKQDANIDGKPGYTSSGGPGFIPIGSLGRWAHGVMPAHRPGRVGRVMKRGQTSSCRSTATPTALPARISRASDHTSPRGSSPGTPWLSP